MLCCRPDDEGGEGAPMFDVGVYGKRGKEAGDLVRKEKQSDIRKSPD